MKTNGIKIDEIKKGEHKSLESLIYQNKSGKLQSLTNQSIGEHKEELIDQNKSGKRKSLTNERNQVKILFYSYNHKKEQLSEFLNKHQSQIESQNHFESNFNEKETFNSQTINKSK